MLSTSLPIKRLKHDYPQWHFSPGKDFYWSPTKQTVYYMADGHPAFLLHELAHAILHHSDYRRDVDLLGYERDAWEYAKNTLSPRYHSPIQDDLIEEALDTYREWLHLRSQCPNCQATGIQIKSMVYKCVACVSSWRVNEARTCRLQRHLISN